MLVVWALARARVLAVGMAAGWLALGGRQALAQELVPEEDM
jgi:hypothetical protein